MILVTSVAKNPSINNVPQFVVVALANTVTVPTMVISSKLRKNLSTTISALIRSSVRL